MATPVPLSCSFCERTQHDVEQLVAGPACYICNRCVIEGLTALVQSPMKVPERLLESAQPETFCTFCGNSVSEQPLAGTGRAFICRKCLLKSVEFMLDAVQIQAAPRRW